MFNIKYASIMGSRQFEGKDFKNFKLNEIDSKIHFLNINRRMHVAKK